MSWHREQERGSALGLASLAWALRWLGFWPARIVSELVVAYFFLTGARARAASRSYLQRLEQAPAAAGRLPKGPRLWQSYQHFRTFGCVSLDRLALWTQMAARFQIDFPQRPLLLELHNSGKGALLLGAHLGSFEAMRALADRSGKPVYLLMFQGASPKLYALLRRVAPQLEQRILHVAPNDPSTILELQRHIDAGHWIAILGDRKELASARRVARVDLLGAPVELPQSPLLLASLLGCPVFTVFGLRLRPFHYELHVERLAERVVLRRGQRDSDLRGFLQLYAQAMERMCTRAPLQWFNFHDLWDLAPTPIESAPRSETQHAS